MDWFKDIYDDTFTIIVGIIIFLFSLFGLIIKIKEEQKAMTTFYIGNNKIEIWEDTETVRTTFPDGSQLVAAPSYGDEEQESMREQLGFDDLWTMCKSHEILHTSIAVGEGKEYSRGLWRAANGIGADTEDFEEEANVLRVQKLQNKIKEINER